MELSNQITHFLELIKKANKIVILTGAGISTESGLPDFRRQGDIQTNIQTDT